MGGVEGERGEGHTFALGCCQCDTLSHAFILSLYVLGMRVDRLIYQHIHICVNMCSPSPPQGLGKTVQVMALIAYLMEHKVRQHLGGLWGGKGLLLSPFPPPPPPSGVFVLGLLLTLPTSCGPLPLASEQLWSPPHHRAQRRHGQLEE